VHWFRSGILVGRSERRPYGRKNDELRTISRQFFGSGDWKLRVALPRQNTVLALFTLPNPICPLRQEVFP
jgi:hypothetical protein